jgi:deoxyribodipyrimidine photolyase
MSQEVLPMPRIVMTAELVFSHKIDPDETDLTRRIELLQSQGISSIIIANTDRKDIRTMPRWIETLRKVSSKSSTDTHICAQYSLKHNPAPKVGLLEKKEHFLRTLEDFYFGADEIFLSFGSHGSEQRAWKTVDALSALNETRMHSVTTISVGYNPYHLDPSDQDRENSRLLEELATGFVSKIYLQFGTDLQKLKTGIEFCKNAAAMMITAKEGSSCNGRSISLVGSLFLPTPQRIAQLKSRPWKGVVLGTEFIGDSTGKQACSLVSEMIKLYQKNEIELLWEAPGIRSEEEANTMTKILLGAASSIRKGKGLNVDVIAEKSTNDCSQESNANSIDGACDDASEDDAKSQHKNLAKHQQQHQQQFWYRSEDACLLVFGSHDVRLQDNRALEEAFKRHAQVLPVFFYTQEEREGNWGCPENTAVAVCLEEALKNLQASLKAFGLPLVYCNGSTNETLKHGVSELIRLIEGIDAKSVYWNKEATPEGRARHSCWKLCLEKHDPTITYYEGQSSLLYDVDKLELKSGFNQGHFGTLMPFLKKCTKFFGPPSRPTPYLDTFRLLENGKPLKSLSKLLDSSSDTSSETTISTDLSDLQLISIHGREKWDEPIRERFPMSEETAHVEVESFVRNGMKKYEKERSRADNTSATSRLSPHFRIGTLSPNQFYWRIEDSGLPYEQLKTISRRLIWRDLAYYHLFCFPDMRTRCIRQHYEQMEWVGSAEEEDRRFDAWKKGMTGYPIVDAGMRELYTTGWMTQSVRMVVASFLTEYLRVDWKKGCEWFHYTLVDADSAINAMMWQNAGRSGIDQWNFVLSPKTASQDPTGEYTKKWVPELAMLPTTNLLHRPWEATEEVLEDARVILGQTYPHRIVKDLKVERQRSVENTLAMRRKSQAYNSSRGYDLIDLPNGQKSVVFTKKEFRIDENGNLLKHDDMAGKKSSSQTKSKRSKKRRKKKVTAVVASRNSKRSK